MTTVKAGRLVIVVLAVALAGLGLLAWRWVDAWTAPVVGRRAPDFALSPLDGGEPVSLRQYRGQPLVINFWATWCPPCVKELPAFERVAREGGVQVLAVNVGDSADEVANFLHQHRLSLPVLQDPTGEAATVYRVAGLPQTFFVDADGVVRHVERGAMEYEEIVEVLSRMQRGGS